MNIDFSAQAADDTVMVFPFYFEGKAVEGVSCALSLQAAGSMGFTDEPLTAQRSALLARLNIAPERLCSCRQTHSRRAVLVEPHSAVYDADALVGSGLAALAVTVADCLPVYLYDTKLKTFAVCHSGWKGTGIVCEALKLMAKNYGTNARDVAAVLGPCIQSCCYRVDEERALQFDREFGSLNGAYPAGKPVRIIKHGQDQTEFFLDMQAANVKLLHDYGVHNIECRHECSVCGGKFGSFRREGAQFTKMLALVFCPQQTV